MKQKSDIRYIADDGKLFMKLADGSYCGNDLHLGLLFRDLNGNVLPTPIMDVISNYIEVDIPEEFLPDYVAPEPEEPEPEIPEPEEPELPVEDIDLADAKIKKLKALMAYDSSPAVNQFFLNGIPEWFNLERRLGLMASLEIAIANNVAAIPFSVGGHTINIPPAMALPMVQDLHFNYADVCFMVTATHKMNIEALNTAKEVLEYDFTQGYPPKKEYAI